MDKIEQVSGHFCVTGDLHASGDLSLWRVDSVADFPQE
jgi:hypothetical protein